MNQPTQCPRCAELCDYLNRQVSDQIDPSVGTPWMRKSPHLPKYVQQLEAKCEAKDRAILNAAEKCSWCNGEGRDNDGETFIDKPCPRCKELWDALSENCGKDYVPRKELDELRDHHRHEKNQLIIELNAAKSEIASNDSHLDELKREHQREQLRLSKELAAAKAEGERLRELCKRAVSILYLGPGSIALDSALKKDMSEALAQQEEK